MATCRDTCIPVGIFWDIENCSVPKWKSALHVVQAIRDNFFEDDGNREVEFMCVCDITKESKYIVQELNQAQVNVVHIDAISKNAADDKLRQNIRRFSDTHSTPATIVLISSDVNFSSDLSDLRYRKKFNIVIIHGQHTHDALLLCATEHFLYDDIVRDVPCRSPSKSLDGQVELIVTGYREDLDRKCIKCKLSKLSCNTGGKVVSITPKYALLRFSSLTVADRAKRRMDGEDFYGSKIHADFSLPGQYPNAEIHNTNKPGTWKDKLSNGCSPKRNKPYSQRKNSPPGKPKQTNTSANVDENKNEIPVQNTACTDEISPFEALVSGTLGTTEESPEHGIQGLVKKFAHDKKSSRQLLMLQQQIYQEEQTPMAEVGRGSSTQFYTHYTKYQETSYYGYNPHWQQNGYQDQPDNSSDQYYNYGRYQNGNEYSQNSYSNSNNSYQCQNHSQNPTLPYLYGNNTDVPSHKGFCPIRSASPSESSASASPCEFDEFPGAVELIVSNLDYNISPREWKHILLTTFHPHVKILHIEVSLQPDNTSLGFIKVGSIEEARFAISQFHRKKIGYKRIHVTLKSDDATKAVSTIRSEAIALLTEAKDNVLPLFKFIELFNKRYNRSVSVSELYKMRDTIEIHEQGGAGRMIHLAPSLQKSQTVEEGADGEVQEIVEHVVCSYHCPEGTSMYAEAVNTSSLPNVKLQLKTFATQLHSLLMTHDGDIPLMSFPACFSAEVTPLAYVYEGGVPLEHLISCVPGVQIVVSSTGVKKISWAENKAPGSPDLSRQCSSPLLAQQLSQFNRDMVDLLKASPNCRMAFSKFIPSYHHHFGRQCRVADYGYSKLMELFEAIPHVLQVIGTGDRKVLTLTHRAQVRRFTADLQRLLKTLPGKLLYLSTLTEEFCKLFNKNWDVVEYGVCHLEDMLSELPAGTITMTMEGNETIISVPRKDQSPEELERTKHFSLEVVDLLKHNHQCRMSFNKFIPAYHHHFGRQCRVSDFGFTKLLDLFESIPHIVEVEDEGEEKIIRLTEPELRKVIGEQIVNLFKQKNVQCFPLDEVLPCFMQHYGFSVPLQDFNVVTVEDLMTRLKHVLKVEVYDGKAYVVLSDRTSAPPLARQVLQLLMDQSGGSLPLMELCSRYKTTFGNDPDIQKIKEELLDYVQISGDDESGVISLTPLQILARDIRILLQLHGKMSLSVFERVFYEQFCIEIKPALYGFPTTVALLMAIPHVVIIKGKGQRRFIHLSGDLQGYLPIIDETCTRPDSDTTFNDSGSAITDEDTPTEERKFSPLDLLGGLVPSNVPSPNLLPDSSFANTNLINFEPIPDYRDNLFFLSEEERHNQMTPLCQTPTSELLQLAAQFLPSSVQKSEKPDDLEGPVRNMTPTGNPSKDILDLLRYGWWRSGPNQHEGDPDRNTSDIEVGSEESFQRDGVKHSDKIDDTKINCSSNGGDTGTKSSKVSVKIEDNKSKTVKTNKKRGDDTGYKVAVQSLSATISYLREKNQEQVKKMSAYPSEVIKDVAQSSNMSIQASDIPVSGKEDNGFKTSEEISKSPIALCPRPLQPGSYWYSKKFQNKNKDLELPSTSPQDVRNVLASLSSQKVTNGNKTEISKSFDQENSLTPTESIDTTESFSVDTITELSAENLTDATPPISKKPWNYLPENNSTKANTEIKNIINETVVKLEKNSETELKKSRSDTTIPKITSKNEMVHTIENCVSEDCMCYEAVFRQDQPLETSSIKSGDSSYNESPGSSPQKKMRAHPQGMSTSSLSDESNNSSINKKKSRIAAKFGQPLD